MLERIIILLTAILGALALSFYGDFILTELVAVAMMIFFALHFFRSIGRSYEVLYIPILLAVFQCLIMSMVVYHVYNDDRLVIALKYDMGVPRERYFGYMVPAVCMMSLGMLLPLVKMQDRDAFIRFTLARVRQYLHDKGNIGILLIVIGAVASLAAGFVPVTLQYAVGLMAQLIYVGALYIYHSNFKSKNLYLGGAFAVILYRALSQGMFGELVYLVGLTGLLLLLGKKISFTRKSIIIVAGIVLVLVIQLVKKDYRDVAWRGDANKAGAGLFFNLALEKISNPSMFFDKWAMFNTVNRFNQGMIVGKVMRYVPDNEPFAEGETIFTALAASFVPRFMWPDKPMAGGHVNMLRFTGFKVEGYSMNISPLGEAYANFGETGGIIFMFFYGLYFNLYILIVLNIARKRPTVLLWLPVLLLNAVQMETDVLMCVNSSLKNGLFAWLCFWAAKKFLKIQL